METLTPGSSLAPPPPPIGPGRAAAPTLGGHAKPSSPWWKVLAGCAIGCGVVGVAVVAFLIWGAWWVVSPGAQVSTDLVITPEAVAVVHLAGDERAHGLTRLLGAVMGEHNRRQRQAAARELPDSLRWLERLGTAQDAQTADAIGMWIPSEATLAVLPAPDGRRHLALAANFRGFVRPIRAIITSAARGEGGHGSVYTHAGHEVTRFSNGSALSFAGGTLLWADQAELVEAALDRVEAETEAAGPAFLPEGAYQRLTAGHVLVGAADNRTGHLTALARDSILARAEDADEDGPEPPAEAPEPPPNPLLALVERLEATTFAVAIPSADRADVTLTGVALDTAAAEAWRAALAERLGGLRERAAAEGLEVEPVLGVAGRDVTLVLRISGLRSLIDAWAEESAAQIADDGAQDAVSSTPPPAEAPPQ